MIFQNFVQFAVKATCIFCGAEKAVGIEEHCEGNVAIDDAKTAAKDTFEHEGWHVIEVPSAVSGGVGVIGMACPNCTNKGKTVR